MTTEYYQIPSQQGFLPLESDSAADPWLAAATSTLTISDWSTGKSKQQANPPSLFEPEDAEASVSWNQVVPLQYKPAVAEVKAPVAPKKFNSTSSKINAWSVVDDNNTISSPSPKQRKQQTKQPVTSSPKPQQAKQPKAKSPVVVEDKPLEDELGQQNRYKTELCKSFTETGACRYGNKCQFAHGKEEIKPILRHPKYKTEICKTFHTTGTCPYGIRCRFIHTRSKEEATVIPKPQEEEEEDADDDAVPQWSKSWTMSLASAVPSKNARNAVVAPEPAF